MKKNNIPHIGKCKHCNAACDLVQILVAALFYLLVFGLPIGWLVYKLLQYGVTR